MAATAGAGKTPAKTQPVVQKNDDAQLELINDDEPATVATDAGLDNALRNSQTAPNQQGVDGWGSDYR